MFNELTESKMIEALDWLYDKVINGVPVPGFDSAKKMAEDYLSKDGTLLHQVNSLIGWQVVKAGTTGFLTGLGGILTMPVTIPVDIAGVLYVQISMISAIAYMGEYDLNDDRVKSLVYVCLAGNSAKDVLKDIGIVVGTKMTTKAIENISGKALTAINQKVGFRLLTKFGEKGVINLGKCVPLIGGVIGGAFDSFATVAIGNIAKETFIERDTAV